MLLISAELSSSALFRLVAAIGLVVPIAARTPPPAAYLHGQVFAASHPVGHGALTALLGAGTEMT